MELSPWRACYGRRGQQDVEIVVGQDQQLAARVARAVRVGILAEGDVVDVTIAILIIQGDATCDLVDRQCCRHRPPLRLFSEVATLVCAEKVGWNVGLRVLMTTAPARELRPWAVDRGPRKTLPVLHVPQAGRADSVRGAVGLHGTIDIHTERAPLRVAGPWSSNPDTGYTANAPVFVTSLAVHTRRAREHIDQAVIGLVPQFVVRSRPQRWIGLLKERLIFCATHRNRRDFHRVGFWQPKPLKPGKPTRPPTQLCSFWVHAQLP